MAKRSIIFVHGHSRGAFEQEEWLRQTVGDSATGRTGRLLEGFKLALRLVEAGEDVPLIIVGSGAAGRHKQPGMDVVVPNVVPTLKPEERQKAGADTLAEMLTHAGHEDMRKAFSYIYGHPRFLDVVRSIHWDVKSDNTFKEAELAVKMAA